MHVFAAGAEAQARILLQSDKLLVREKRRERVFTLICFTLLSRPKDKDSAERSRKIILLPVAERSAGRFLLVPVINAGPKFQLLPTARIRLSVSLPSLSFAVSLSKHEDDYDRGLNILTGCLS
jgi:hypothetical protein